MIDAFVLVIASSALQPPGLRAAPRAMLDSYVGRDDYPASAMSRGEEGNVAFQLTVGVDGRVTGCAILASSGSSALDNATCRIMRSRARFTPARDDAGNAVPDAGLAVLSWSLVQGARGVQGYLPAAARLLAPVPPPAAGRPAVQPARARANLASYVADDDYPASALQAGDEGTVRFSLDVDAGGRVTHCSITGSSGSSALDNATCRIMRSRARFTPARDFEGNPVPDSVRSSITWRRVKAPQPAPSS